MPPSESASNEKNIETICPAPESQVRVISSKITSERSYELESDKREPDHEMDRDKRENNLSVEVVDQTLISSEDAQQAEYQQSSSGLDSNARQKM